ncbi:MAG: peptidoglycan DD-metalloendopeptidase family protein [Alphaproteobacteria bacterium]|nr:peptidoglycan DD-metalloendopeptidase family protein [Alphaproteobacteria bacterium]
MPALILAILALSLCGAFPVSVLADARQDVRQKIEATEKSITAGRVQQRSLSNQARAVRDQVEGLRIRAAIAAHDIQQEEAALSRIEERQAALRRQDKVHRRRLERMQESMASSIAALIRMQRQPAAAFLAAPGTMLDAARGGRLLAAALPALQADADEIGALLAAAAAVRDQLSRAQSHHVAVVATLSGRRQELQDLLRAQANSEQQLWRAGAAEGRRLAALAAKASGLRALMQRLNSEEQQRQGQPEQNSVENPAQMAARTAATNLARQAARMAADRAERRRRKFAADMARALATSRPRNGGNEKRRSAPPTGQRLAMAPGRVPFSKIRGRLRLPAEGKRVGKFGESTGFGPRAQGITLQTRKGAQVVVPYDGRVVFAGPFRDYGLILIISHGEGYHTLLAGLSTLQAVVGQSLLTGEPVGRMGGNEKQSLYIELRRKGVAIDPNPWWSSSRERASG